jgi:hypothetical protein
MEFDVSCQSSASIRHKACTGCMKVLPATSDFFSPRSDGRLKLSSACKVCAAAKARESRKDPEKASKHRAAVAASFKKRYSTDADFRATERERLKLYKRRMRECPERREALNAIDRAWRKANWDRVRQYKHKSGALAVFHAMQRHASQLRATPFWSERGQIALLYKEARRLTMETGIEHHVDHVVPLRGKRVSGLHVFANLRIITADENKRKSNKLLEELLV